jgi:hypothetical protein
MNGVDLPCALALPPRVAILLCFRRDLDARHALYCREPRDGEDADETVHAGAVELPL